MDVVGLLENLRQKEGSVFVASLGDIEVSFRLPSYAKAAQWQLLLSTIEPEFHVFVYESIFKECILDSYLANFKDDIQAGIPETIARLILFLSGVDENFQDYTTNILENYRNQSNSFVLTMKRIICSTFTGYKLSDLDNLNYQDLLLVYSQAERILIDQGIMEGKLEFVKPQEQKEKKFRVEDIIKQDQTSYKEWEDEFVSPQKQQELNLREKLLRKAEEEERKFRQAQLQKQKRR